MSESGLSKVTNRAATPATGFKISAERRRLAPSSVYPPAMRNPEEINMMNFVNLYSETDLKL